MPSPYDYSTPQVNVGTYFDAMREGRADRLAVETEQRNNALAKYLPQALNGNEQAQAMAMQSAPVDQMANLAQSFRGMKAEELAAKRREQAESASLALWADTPEKWAIANAEAKKKNPNTPDIPFEQRGMLIAQGQSVAEMLKQAHDEKMLANDTSRTTAQNALTYEQMRALRAKSGPGGGSVGPRGEDASSLGGQSTVVVTDPYAQMSSPQQRDMFYRQESRAHDKIAGDARNAARTAAKSQAQMEQFVKLNQKTSTGPTYGLPIIGDVTKFAARNFNSDFANMEAITAAVAPNQRPPGSGPTSDYDAKQFERATVGVDKPGDSNVRIATAAIAQAKRDREYAQFVDWYFQKMRTNQGMDQAWLEYVDSNPIFDPQDQASFSLNKGSTPWRQWFGASGQSSPSAAKPPGGAGPTQGGLPVVRTQAEFDALPAGSPYVEPDGKKYRKP